MTTADEEFVALTAPFCRELVVHCYRMLGSIHDADDLVQETYLRAWRAYAKFEGRSSLRVWLYTIATRACLTALESRARPHLPADLREPAGDAHGVDVLTLEGTQIARITAFNSADLAPLFGYPTVLQD